MSPRAEVVPTVEVVLPVHGALHHLRWCLRSLRRFTPGLDHLTVVDDASPPRVTRFLREVLREQWPDRSTLLVNEVNRGFLRTANRGLGAGQADRVVLLNSDTVLTPQWLEGLTAAAAPDDVGLVCPLSNHANLTRLAFPWGADALAVAAAVRAVSPRDRPEIGIASGFCLLIERDVLDTVGLFDEAFGRGYFEEADLCMRAMEAGYRVVADDATFIYHHGWSSFGEGERTQLMARNRRLFEQRWGDAHTRWRQLVRRRAPFAALEADVRSHLGLPAETAEAARPATGPRWAARRRQSAEGFTGELRAARARRIVAACGPPPASQCSRHPPEAVGRGGAQQPLSLVVVADSLAPGPDTRALLRLLSELLLRGVRVHAITSGPVDPTVFADPALLRPRIAPCTAVPEVAPHADVVMVTAGVGHEGRWVAERDGAPMIRLLGDEEAPEETSGAVPELVPGGWLVARSRAQASSWWGRGHRIEVVSPGADPDVFSPAAGRPRPGRVVVPWQAGGGGRPQAVGAVLRGLRRAGLDPLLVVHGPRDAGLPVELEVCAEVVRPVSSPELADVLASAAAYVEPCPVAGFRRLRRQAQAVGVPLLVAGPVPDGELVRPGRDCWTAPGGVAAELVRWATELAAGGREVSRRVLAGLRSVHREAFPAEVEALAGLVERLATAAGDSLPCRLGR